MWDYCYQSPPGCNMHKKKACIYAIENGCITAFLSLDHQACLMIIGNQRDPLQAMDHYHGLCEVPGLKRILHVRFRKLLCPKPAPHEIKLLDSPLIVYR